MTAQNSESSGISFRFETQKKLSLDKFSFFVLVFSLFSVILQAVLILVNLGRFPPQVPIFYSRPWGEPMLGPPLALWVLPAFTIIFMAVNYTLALYFIDQNPFINRALIVFSAVIAFAALYDITRITGLLV